MSSSSHNTPSNSDDTEHPLAEFRFCPKCGNEAFKMNNIKSKRCGCCGFVYYFNPSAAVACFVRDEEDRVLVAVRAVEPSKGELDLPGGFVDSYETAEQAVRREVEEETGLRVGRVDYLFSKPNIYRYSNFDVHTLDLCFECYVESLEGVVASDDVAQLRVVAIADLEAERFAFVSIQGAVRSYKERWMEQRRVSELGVKV